MFRLPIKNNAGSAPTSYPKPKDWLPMPSFAAGEHVFNGLFYVTEYSRQVQIDIAGNYTVDWGDGVVENYNAGIASHTYDYSTITSAVLTDGTKQVIVSVVPQDGSDLTKVDLNSSVAPYNQNWLEVNLSGTNISVVKVNGLPALKAFDFKGTNNITNFSSFFSSTKALTHVISIDTTGANNFYAFFFMCHSLIQVPALDGTLVTNMYQMFTDCFSITTIPAFDAPLATSTSRIYRNCEALPKIPLITFPSTTTLLSAFANCPNLSSIPALDIGGATDIRVMFTGSTNIKRIELYNIASAIDISPCTHMDRDAIVEVFNNLKDLTGFISLSITITGMTGVAALTAADRDIVLNKNWTIVE